MITVHSIGYNFLNYESFDIQRPDGSGDCLLLFLRTDAEIMINGVYQPVEKFHFFLYPAGVAQYYRKLRGAFINDWMHFSIDPENGYIENLHIPFCTPIKLSDNSILNDMMLDLFSEFFNTGDRHLQIMDEKADSFFRKFSELYALEQNIDNLSRYREPLTLLRHRLLNFESRPAGVEAIAQELHMSVSYLEHLYKRLFQTTIRQDLIDGRIRKACILLRGTAYTVSQIAAMCGYESLEHFSRQFKRIMHCSPRQYRQQE